MVSKETQVLLEAAGWKGEATTDRMLEALPVATEFRICHRYVGGKPERIYEANTSDPIEPEDELYRSGDTPAEALAALWLELKKQKII